MWLIVVAIIIVFGCVFCSCIPLYNFNYVYSYVMASQKSFVDRFVSCFISVLELILTIIIVRCLELSKQEIWRCSLH